MRPSSIRLAYRDADVVTGMQGDGPSRHHPRRPGSEFASRDLDRWAYQNTVMLDFSRAGKPTDNAFHRGVQRPTARGMLEHALVVAARRMATILQQGTHSQFRFTATPGGTPSIGELMLWPMGSNTVTVQGGWA